MIVWMDEWKDGGIDEWMDERNSIRHRNKYKIVVVNYEWIIIKRGLLNEQRNVWTVQFLRDVDLMKLNPTVTL